MAAECLGRLYHQKENDRLREPIIEALLQIDVMTADEAGNNPVMEFVYLEVISKSDNDEHRLAVLDRLPAAMYSEKTSRTLLSLSQGRDMESPLVKEKEIGLLAMSACQREADPDVMAYLAQVAKGDPCTGCQRAAITSDLVLRDKKTFWPVYRELLSRPETAETTVEAVAAHARLPESVPLLIGMLDTKDPALGHTIAFGLSRATGVSSQALGLEYVMNERVALRGLLSGYSEHAEQEAVENLKSTWRSWWEQHGDDFLERHGLSK